MKKILFLILISFLSGSAVAADKPLPVEACSEDLAKSGDPADLSRIKGSRIIHQAKWDLVEYEIWDKGTEFNKTDKYSVVPGKLFRTVYCLPKSVRATPSTIKDIYEKTLTGNGFQKIYQYGYADKSYAGQIGGKKVESYDFKSAGTYHFSAIDSQGMVLVKTDGSNKKYVTFEAFRRGGASEIPQDKKIQNIVIIDILEADAGEALEMEQVPMPQAAEMAKTLADKGSIDLYGIYFDTGKSDIKPESAKTLEQIGALMKLDTALKLDVIGHTDNVGGKEANDKLSLERAQSVVNSLTTTYAVPADRLKPYGKGMSEPKASNDNESGRAQNRRVQLKKSS